MSDREAIYKQGESDYEEFKLTYRLILQNTYRIYIKRRFRISIKNSILYPELPKDIENLIKGFLPD